MAEKFRRRIILVYGNIGLITSVIKRRSIPASCPVLFLSPDAVLLRQVTEMCEHKREVIRPGDDLQKIARKFRQEYIGFVGKMAPADNPLCWFLTSFSEKNPFVSNVFLQFCYLKLFEDAAGKHGSLIVICGSRPLMTAILDNFSRRSDLCFECHDPALLRIPDRIRLVLFGWVNKAVFAARYICRIAVSRLYRFCKGHPFHEGGGRGRVSIHAWTDARSFGEPPEYRDVYFGDLQNRMNLSRDGFFYLTTVLPTMFYPAAVWKLAKTDANVCLFEEFLKIRDVFTAILRIRRGLPVHLGAGSLDGIDLSAVISDEMAADRSVSSRSETSLLYYYAGRRLSGRMNLKLFIYTFENHMWEKMLCAGFRKNRSPACLTGYAHSVISPMYLFYSLSSAEKGFAPLPDRILVNGRRAKEILLESGFDSIPVDISGAYRYDYLARRKTHRPGAGTRRTVLVVSTSGLNETLELVGKAAEAFDGTDVTVFIRLHPNLPVSKVLPYLPPLPANVSLSREPADALLERAGLLLFTETAVAVEALASHVPVLHVRSDLRIDMNIFEGIAGIGSAGSPGEIRTRSLALLDYTGYREEKFERIVHEFFSPVNGAVVQSLLSTSPCRK